MIPQFGHQTLCRDAERSFWPGSSSPKGTADVHRIESLLDLSGVHDTEFMAIGIGHYHPADLALTDVDARCPEVDETVDLPLLITVDRWSDVVMQPVLPGLWPQWRTTPGDLGTTTRRANRRLLVLVPDQGPAKRLAPEVPDVLRAVARKRSYESAVGEETVARLDDAELVALGVCEHDVRRLGTLANLDVPPAEFERPRHRLLLVREGGARQIEVHLVLPDLLLLSWEKPDPEAGVIAR